MPGIFCEMQLSYVIIRIHVIATVLLIQATSEMVKDWP